MGCDIHLWVELFEHGRWAQPIDLMIPNRWHKPDGDEWERREPETIQKDFYSGRNYDLFSILADVRNGFGFAGCATGKGFVPIADPRGIPDDASPEYKQRAEVFGPDGHSHSWHTLHDLLEYDWDQNTVTYGVVPITVYAQLRGTDETPTSYSGGVMGRNIETVDMKMADTLLAERNASDLFAKRGDPERETKTSYYVQMQWPVTYKDAAGQFYAETIPVLQTLAEERGLAPEHLRIVFFFDN